MILDILLILIVLISMIYGYRKGFMSTFIHSVGWVVALVGAYFLLPFAKDLLSGHTGVYDMFYSFFQTRFSGSTMGMLDISMSTLPNDMSENLVNTGTDLVESLSQSFAGIAFTIFTYAVTFILLKFILWLLLRLLSKDYNDGIQTVGDGIGGLVFGLLRGAVICSVLLLLILPLANIMAPDSTEAINSSLDNSFFAGFLYEDNILLVLMQGLFV